MRLQSRLNWDGRGSGREKHKGERKEGPVSIGEETESVLFLVFASLFLSVSLSPFPHPGGEPRAGAGA